MGNRLERDEKKQRNIYKKQWNFDYLCICWFHPLNRSAYRTLFCVCVCFDCMGTGCISYSLSNPTYLSFLWCDFFLCIWKSAGMEWKKNPFILQHINEKLIKCSNASPCLLSASKKDLMRSANRFFFSHFYFFCVDFGAMSTEYSLKSQNRRNIFHFISFR